MRIRGVILYSILVSFFLTILAGTDLTFNFITWVNSVSVLTFTRVDFEVCETLANINVSVVIVVIDGKTFGVITSA